jgi:thiol-disulfide isomerase/thioredoxin
MKHTLILTVIILQAFGYSQAQKVKVIKVDELVKLYDKPNDTTYVINFWATWCKPCVEEMPYFQELDKWAGDSAKKVKVIMVSLDFKEDLKTSVIPFLKKKKYTFTAMLLDEIDANYFIPKIENKWTGAIPFTLVVNHDKKYRNYVEDKMTKEELWKLVTEYKITD